MICYFNGNGNDILNSVTNVFLTSSFASKAHGYYFFKNSFRRNMALYIARGRDVIETSWINQSDIYLAPKDNDK